jgi:hypothetical protein
MKTTIDFPDDLLHRAKIVAAQRKTTLRAMVLQGVDYVITHDLPLSDPKAERTARAAQLLDLMSGIQITEPVGKWDRDASYDRAKA